MLRKYDKIKHETYIQVNQLWNLNLFFQAISFSLYCIHVHNLCAAALMLKKAWAVCSLGVQRATCMEILFMIIFSPVCTQLVIICYLSVKKSRQQYESYNVPARNKNNKVIFQGNCILSV